MIVAFPTTFPPFFAQLTFFLKLHKGNLNFEGESLTRIKNKKRNKQNLLYRIEVLTLCASLPDQGFLRFGSLTCQF